MDIKTDLVLACIKRDEKSQKQLYVQLLPYLRAVSLRYLRNKSFAKDVLQESFVLIFKKIDQFDIRKGSFHKWAVKIVINTCLNYNSRIAKVIYQEFEIEKHDKGISPEVIKKLSNDELMKQLKKMPTTYFEVFNLHVIDGYSHQEIADLLSIEVDLSRQRLSRARSWLKNRFNQVLERNPNSHPSKSLFL
ncbi:RNA polymerase sigma factor [Chitinophagales bacterium]|nr:RNA polymerase sigma factor [Chitinophagales bacterium]